MRDPDAREPTVDAAVIRYLQIGSSRAPDHVVAATRAAVADTRQASWRRWLPFAASTGVLGARPVAIALVVVVALLWPWTASFPPEDSGAGRMPSPMPAPVDARLRLGDSLIDAFTVAGGVPWTVRGTRVEGVDPATGTPLRVVDVAEATDGPVSLIGSDVAVVALSQTAVTTFATIIPLDGGDPTVIDLGLQYADGIAVGGSVWIIGWQTGILMGDARQAVREVDVEGRMMTVVGLPRLVAAAFDGTDVLGITDAGRLISINGGTRRVAESRPLDAMDGEVTVAGSSTGTWLIVDSGATASVYRVDSKSGQRLASIPLGRGDVVTAFADRGSLWVVMHSGRLLQVDGGRVIKVLEVGQRVTSGASAGPPIWLQTADGALLRIQP